MKLIQANVWGARLGKQVIKYLKEHQPDIVCLQEAVDTTGDGLMSSTIKDICGYTQEAHAFFSPVFSFNLMQKKAGFGNAIISTRPFEKQETIFTGLEFKENFDFDSDSGNIRNLQHAVFSVNGKTLNVLNHHGHHIDQHKNGDAETMRQCTLIANYVKSLEGYVILTGDFNLSPHSESLEIINNTLRNLAVEYKLKTTRNQFTHKVEVCDYIFTSKDITVNSFYVSDDLISDHSALVLEFELG